MVFDTGDGSAESYTGYAKSMAGKITGVREKSALAGWRQADLPPTWGGGNPTVCARIPPLFP
jgi:hypothetical protein